MNRLPPTESDRKGDKHMDELKKGQEVVIKSAKLSGTVISSRDDGAEGVIYKVLIPERTMYFRHADLEPWPDPSAKLRNGSAEWLDELARFNELGKRCLAKPQDKDLMMQLANSGEKLGFIIPIK
ncbi:MAG TPA: hypothetical protein VF394_14840 [Candidatus Acidoferrum sp.]